jgi:1-deoxy-D-xylulose-5-phosphate reductoisomerase
MVTAPKSDAGAPRRISLFGATGSIGASTADILRRHPDRFSVDVVTANTDSAALASVARELGATLAVIADPAAYDELRSALAGTSIEVAAGETALVDAARRPVDMFVAAIVGAAGLPPTMAAIEAGADIVLANKECLVCAGELFMAAVKRKGVRLLPADSEHNAIFQVLGEGGIAEVDRVTLTASGGPFLNWSPTDLARATPDEAAAHPNWSMGRKISVDSSTLMNKGLEVIEAHHLFGLAPDRIDVLIHPQSIVHGLVTYRDGSVLAGLSVPDMRIPLANCLWWPDRAPGQPGRLGLADIGSLTFQAPDPTHFPGLALARDALDAGPRDTNILNAANEIAVHAFLQGRIGYLDISSLCEDVLTSAKAINLPMRPDSLDEALAIDAEGRRLAREVLTRFAAANREAEIT